MSAPCSDCRCHVDGAHYGNCPRINAAFQALGKQPIPGMMRMPSAYDREQQALHDRLDATLRRIEAVELEVARLKTPNDGWCRCGAHDGPHMHQVAVSSPLSPLPDEGT